MLIVPLKEASAKLKISNLIVLFNLNYTLNTLLTKEPGPSRTDNPGVTGTE